ncbi:MAG: hypothetical protein NTY15_12170, partial [Planctomycetota bacterium]|nr:hypothetical protein [Planctomycetota bacterium]
MREFYTADEVRLRIIDLYENGVALSLKSQNDRKLQRSVKKHFGGWRRAVESLGLGSELSVSAKKGPARGASKG